MRERREGGALLFLFIFYLLDGQLFRLQSDDSTKSQRIVLVQKSEADEWRETVMAINMFLLLLLWFLLRFSCSVCVRVISLEVYKK